MVHHLLIIGQHLIAAGEIAHALVQADLVGFAPAQLLRGDAIKDDFLGIIEDYIENNYEKIN